MNSCGGGHFTFPYCGGGNICACCHRFPTCGFKWRALLIMKQVEYFTAAQDLTGRKGAKKREGCKNFPTGSDDGKINYAYRQHQQDNARG